MNIASRLESSVAKPGKVVIGEHTRTIVGSRFECRELGSFSLKGKTREVQVFEVVGMARAEAETDPPVLGGA